MSIAQKSLAILATAAVSAAVVVSFATTISTAEAAALTDSQIQSIVSLLQSFGADATTIANVQASLMGQPTSGGTGGTMTSSACPYTWNTNLTVGSTGADVMALQKFLNSNAATQVAASGAGSPGNESTYFGSLTKAAVAKYQTANGISPAAGYVGPLTRASLNAQCTSGSTGGTSGGGTTPAGTGLTVAAGVQPTNSLAPQGASRVPFTRFTLTAGNDGDVTVNSVTVQRTGLGADAGFAGVILIDESTGIQVGTAKTFNSNHQATIGASMVVPRGTTKSFLVAGNMASDLSGHTGEAPSIAVVAVNTSANVSGSLPITGAQQTLNSTLTVGTLTLNTSNAYATNSTQNEPIGTTAFKFTGFRLTAGSAEDVRLRSVTWNQTGSVSGTDLANVVTVVNGTSYPTTLSADGKYYYTNLGSGVVVPKGNQIEVYVQGDIVGSNSSGRTVIFDVDKNTDIFATGETYGYGISPATGSTNVPSARTSAPAVTNGTPYFYAAQITITGSSVTTISRANEVPAQNIALNVPNQPLGGYVVDLTGEGLTVQESKFTVSSSSSAGGPITSASIVDENGSVVAGPVDENSSGVLDFTDTVTYPTGRHVYTIRGKIDSTTNNGATVYLSTTPSSQWTNVKGANSGNTVSLSGFSSAITLNTMTVQAGSVAVGVSSNPASQTLVPGGSQVLFANYQFDASQSGEDVRFSSIPTTLTFGGTSNKGDLSSCQYLDGATALNTGSNVLNPSNATATTSAYTVTVSLDQPVTVAKGTVKTIGLRCNISGSATSGGTYSFAPQAAANFTFTGATSGTSITGSDTSSPTITVTIGAGSATVTTDASAPGYMLAAVGGSTGATNVVNNAMKFHAQNEDIVLQKVGLQLTNTSSSSAGDLTNGHVTIWDGATKVGDAYFSGNNTTATSSLTQTVTIPKNSDKTLTVALDLAPIMTGGSATSSGALVAVDYLNAQGVGAQSGSTFNLGASAGSTAAAGTRVMKSVPTVALDSSLAGTGLADGRLMRFKVTADAAGPIGITELNFTFATTSATLSNVNVYVYSDSGYSQPVSGLQTGGQFSTTNGMSTWNSSATNFEFTAYSGTASTTLQVPAGATRYFEVRGSVAGVQTGSSVTTILQGASSFVGCGAAGAHRNPLCTAAASSLGNTFIWSPNSTTTAVRADNDWTGGYGISGLPTNGLISTRSN
jgi:hypothetical protein